MQNLSERNVRHGRREASGQPFVQARVARQALAHVEAADQIPARIEPAGAVGLCAACFGRLVEMQRLQRALRDDRVVHGLRHEATQAELEAGHFFSLGVTFDE